MKQVQVNYGLLTFPCAIAPTTTTTGPSSATSSIGFTNLSEEWLVPYFLQPTGKWSVTGFRITFNSFIGPSDARIENL